MKKTKKPKQQMVLFYSSLNLAFANLNEKLSEMGLNYEDLQQLKFIIDGVESMLTGHIRDREYKNITDDDLKELNKINEKLNGDFLEMVVENSQLIYDLLISKTKELVNLMWKAKIIPPYPPETVGVQRG